MQDVISKIEERISEIVTEVATLRSRAADLEIEAKKLADVQNSLRALYPVLDATGSQHRDADEKIALAPSLANVSDEVASSARSKPASAPPMTVMIEEALHRSHLSGSPGLTSAGIASFIKGRYWPEVEVASVGPIAWRMWRRSQVGKDGPRYYLLDREDLYPKPAYDIELRGDGNGSEEPSSDPSEGESIFG